MELINYHRNNHLRSSLPLDRCGWLARDVVDNARKTFDLIADTKADLLARFIRFGALRSATRCRGQRIRWDRILNSAQALPSPSARMTASIPSPLAIRADERWIGQLANAVATDFRAHNLSPAVQLIGWHYCPQCQPLPRQTPDRTATGPDTDRAHWVWALTTID
jgi:hypothetical protein